MTTTEDFLLNIKEGDLVLLAGRHSFTEPIIVARVAESADGLKLRINGGTWMDPKTGKCECSEGCTLYYREPTDREASIKLEEIERDRLVDTLRTASLSTPESRELLPAIKKLIEMLG